LWFSIDHRKKNNSVIEDHLDGKPIRKIADKEKKSKSAVKRALDKQIKNLPHNNSITKKYCNKFCGIMAVDGKYIKVRGYKKSIPLLWGIDYLTHDIPVYDLAPSENYESCLKYFGYLKSINYPLKIVVCDDNENIKMAAKYIFPNVLIQTCQNHFMENIRRDLRTRTEDKYKNFVIELKQELFSRKITKQDFRIRALKLCKKYKDDQIKTSYLIKIDKAFDELTASTLVPSAPRDTNLIELYNSHLQARLKSIKGFKSFGSAEKWLNAYILRRRFRKFCDCSRRFRYLNGKTSISQTCRKNANLPLLFI